MARQDVLREYCVEQIHEKGQVSIGLGLSPRDIEPVFDAFGDVIEATFQDGRVIDEDIFKAFRFETPGRAANGTGYLEQRRVGTINLAEPDRTPCTDNKYTLHYLPTTDAYVMKHYGGPDKIPLVVRTLISYCAELHAEVKKSIRAPLQALGLAEVLMAPPDRPLEDIHIIRLLRYLLPPAKEGIIMPKTSGKELAEFHLDRSRMSLPFSEGKPGLAGAPGSNGFADPNLTVEQFEAMAAKAMNTPIRHVTGQAKLFAGAGYYHLPQELQDASGNLPPLLHGVLDGAEAEALHGPTEKALAGGQDKFRDAAVAFINEHMRVLGWSVPSPAETGYTEIHDFLEQRQNQSNVA
jgi:hypothetical protein